MRPLYVSHALFTEWVLAYSKYYGTFKEYSTPDGMLDIQTFLEIIISIYGFKVFRRLKSGFPRFTSNLTLYKKNKLKHHFTTPLTLT